MVQHSMMVVLKFVMMEFGGLSLLIHGPFLIQGLSVHSLDSPGDVSILANSCYYKI